MVFSWINAGILALLSLYGLHRLSMVLRLRWGEPQPLGADMREGGSVVTVQLPLYNERAVAARLIRAVGALDFPADRLEIQVLDDSTDETRAVVDREIETLAQRGLDARVLRRDGRTGFKAGALARGMEVARGEIFCIFDADFLPRPSFLRELLPAFDDPGVGMVQARWEHINREESALTRGQSVLLDGHFVIEHTVRHACGLFFNFNGTAGLWRRRAIEDAGGWQHDTLTEDLDLSYRAQLAGWRFIYAPHVTAPSEVPATIDAFKTQQQRWAKGSAQVARKLMGEILRARISWRIKLEAVVHLTQYMTCPLILLLFALLPFTLAEQGARTGWGGQVLPALLTLLALSPLIFYEAGQRAIGRGRGARLRDVVLAACLGVGICMSQSRAVVQGLLDATGHFIRTPKRGSETATPYPSRSQGFPGLEFAAALWVGWALGLAMDRGLWGAAPFLILSAVGFTWVGVLSLQEWARHGAPQPSSFHDARAQTTPRREPLPGQVRRAVRRP